MAADSHSLFSLLAWGDSGYGDEFVEGVATTLFISFSSYAIAAAIGLFGAWAKLCHIKALNRACEAYTTLVRSLPELLLIFLIFYAGTSTLASLLVAVGLAEQGLEIDPFAAVIAALGLIYGAYLTDVLRGGIQAVPKGQIEAAKAIGLTFSQTFVSVLMPQAIRQILPTWVNTAAEMVKASTLLSIIGVGDLLLASQEAISRTFMNMPFYLFAGFLYFAINFGIERLGRFVERKTHIPS